MGHSALEDRLKARVRSSGSTLVFAEGHDDRVRAAARRLQSEGLASVVLIGSGSDCSASDELHLVDPARSPELDSFAEQYVQARPRTKLSVARRLIGKPLFYAGMMVKSGAADALVAGVSLPSARVLEASLMTIGLADGIETPSSSFLMLFERQKEDHRPAVLLFSDCALTIEPTAEQLADIGIASATTYRALVEEEPRVAFLSFSTRGSARQPQAEKVARAAEIAAARAPELAIDGELQVDAALTPRVAALKVPGGSSVAGQANVLIFPSLDAGNIGYKLAQYLGRARSLGPLLQGFARPVSDLSRGATVDDIVTTAALTLAQSIPCRS